MITKLNIMVILIICSIMYVANNLSIIVFFCLVLILFLIQLCIPWCTYYIMHNIKIIYVYKIRCSQQNMYTITVDFLQMGI